MNKSPLDFTLAEIALMDYQKFFDVFTANTGYLKGLSEDDRKAFDLKLSCVYFCLRANKETLARRSGEQ